MSAKVRIHNLKTVDVNLTAIGGSALTDKTIAVPVNRDEKTMSSNIPITYVPMRNTIFLGIAAAYAEVLKADEIWIGANNIDYSGYRDCRPEFLESIEDTIAVATSDCGISPSWVRGFIEGEGCFSRCSYDVTEGKKYYPVFSLQQSDLASLEKLKKFFGGRGHINERKYVGKSNISKKQSWEYRLTYHEAYLVYELMQGHMKNEGKQEQLNQWPIITDNKYFDEEEVRIKFEEKGIKLPIRIKAPLLHLKKADIIKLGIGLKVPYHLTWSCYQGGDRACGVCDSCKLRLAGFKEAESCDPIPYD